MTKAFTLLEINLAMLVMAGGVLSMVSLYSLGYRENLQSREDMEAAALADKNLNALATMLSSTNLTWSQWKAIGTRPSGGEETEGWDAYYDVNMRDDDSTVVGGRGKTDDPNTTAQGVFSAVPDVDGTGFRFDPGHLKCGLVLVQQGSTCSFSFRGGRRAGTLMAQPLYYTEVFFQGKGGAPQGGGK